MMKKIFKLLLILLLFSSTVEASYQVRLEIPWSESLVIVCYTFAPDGLESQGLKLVSRLAIPLGANIQEMSYEEFMNELLRVLNGEFQHPETYGLLVSSECDGLLYKLGFYDNDKFVSYRYLSRVNFCDSKYIIQLLLNRNKSKNLVNFRIEVPIKDSLKFILQELRYDDFCIQGDKIYFRRGYLSGIITGSVRVEGYYCQIIEGQANCEGEGFYDLNNRYGEGSAECYGEATVRCVGYGIESDNDYAECLVTVSSPKIDLNSRTVEGVAHIECVFDWYDFDFSKDVYFKIKGQ